MMRASEQARARVSASFAVSITFKVAVLLSLDRTMDGWMMHSELLQQRARDYNWLKWE